MEMDFKNKYGEWALITGANSGIGKAIVMELAQKGFNIILVARRKAELEEVALELQYKNRVLTKVIPTDLSNQSEIDALYAATQQLNIGFLVLSAGIENNGSFVKNSLDKELQVIELNIVSSIKLAHHYIQLMEPQRKGGVLFVSSLTAHIPSPYFSNYAATKSYIFTLATSLYGELRPKGIAVSVLSPGVTETPMSEKTGVDWSKTKVMVMNPEDVAKEAIKNFGKKLWIIPGKGNRIFAFIAQKFLSYDKLALSNLKMMQKAVNPSKL